MKFQIQQNKLRDEVKKRIFDGFGSQAIESTGINGLSEDPISFEIFDRTEFVGAIVVQPFWEQLHIKYLFIEKNYRGQGIARQLMNHALEFGIKCECHFAFVETMSFQAPKFYQKMGFVIEFSRPGYAENTTFHYLKKSLNSSETQKKITRIGVYGVAIDTGKILTVRQKQGPYADKLDFPGGGIEFGESAEQAMRREFAEEVAMEFDSMQLIDNLTVTVDIPGTSSNQAYTFFHMGMIYQLKGCRSINEPDLQELQHIWVDPRTLSKVQCSSLLWKYKQTYINGLR